ncbi:hypothetical protein AL051_09220 [Pseudomonas amygdali pv. dendropanacis]|nr:hypothetical protein AL051_09220 [Pseudomonas amygdali pv. dendropanacis]
MAEISAVPAYNPYIGAKSGRGDDPRTADAATLQQPKRFIAKVPVARIPTLDSVVGGRAWPNRPPAAKTVLPTSSKSCWLPRPMPEVNALDRHC